MVDFQSRDTRRGPTVDDEPEDESESSADTGESSDGGAEAADGPETGASGGATAESEPDAAGEPETTGDRLADEHGPADTGSDGDHPVETGGSAASEPADDPLADPAGTGEGAENEPDAAAAVAAADSEATATAATPGRTVDVAVVTVSGDRAALEDSVSGAFEAAGHDVTRRERLRGGYDAIQQMVDSLVGREAVDVVVTVGGAGLAADEMAIEAVHPLLEKALPGFGEAFRSLLADHIGTGIVGVRSTAGVSGGTLVFCLPGDAEAAGLAVREILAAEAPVLVDQLEG